MLLEPVKKYRCTFLDFSFAEEPWELQEYWALRKKIFCEEQGIFQDIDKDSFDAEAIPIIASCACMGMQDQITGIVRIDERAPGVWFGSRLGVAEDYRTISRFKAYHLFPMDRSIHPFTISVGASLIFKAVSTANALGCKSFFANVQQQNVSFFERLHWKSLGTLELHGQIHHRMEADLNFYPPSVFINSLRKSIA